MAGQNILKVRVVVERPDVVLQNLATAAAAEQGYQVTSVGGNTLILSRRYIPTWAIVVAAIGAVFLLIGLLFLFVKETETVTVTLAEREDMTRISISGVATRSMIARLDAVLAALPSAGAADRA